MMYCDICQQPMFGFAFRCASNERLPQTEGGVLFDLCFEHYNGDEHSLGHPFHCVLPSDDLKNDGLVLPVFLSQSYKACHIMTCTHNCHLRLYQPPRSTSTSHCYQLLGIYPGALVAGLPEATQLEGETALNFSPVTLHYT